MNTSSAQPNCSITSSDTIGVIAQEICTVIPNSVTSDTITLTGTGSSYYISGGSSTITIGSGIGYSSGTINISNINPTSFSWNEEEFVNCLPSWDRIQKMCDEYPGLKIAFEKFATTYKLVKDDYDAPPEKRIKP